MDNWQPKKQYNNNLNGYEIIIHYKKEHRPDKDIIKGKIKSIFDTYIVIDTEQLNINCLDPYLYDMQVTVCFNLIDKIMVKDHEIVRIKEIFHENNTDICVDIIKLINNFIDEYVEI